MDSAIAYVVAFVALVGLLVAVSHYVWKRQLAAMPQPPRWLEATRYIWCAAFGMPWETLPRIIFVPGDFFVCNGVKVAGNSDMMAVTVAVPAPTTPVHKLALTHELRHRALALQGRDPDGEHVGPDWQPGGIVAATIQGLIDRGM